MHVKLLPKAPVMNMERNLCPRLEFCKYSWQCHPLCPIQLSKCILNEKQ